MKLEDVITLRGGARVRDHITQNGLVGADIDAVPAAAGGPKGLGLIEFDKFLFGEWFVNQPPRTGRRRMLAGASIGAWRMAAAASVEPVARLDALAASYTAQIYPYRPASTLVTARCREIVQAALGPRVFDKTSELIAIAARGRGWLDRGYSKQRFAAASLSNIASRALLGRHFERMIFRAAGSEVPSSFDAFGWNQVDFSDANMEDALLASGSIPFVLDPQSAIHDAPPGFYWDGGIVDYHLAWPWSRLEGLVLYPHYSARLIPGWLDKSLPWRRGRGDALSNVLIVAPSDRFLASLPLKKLPDRSDFLRFGNDNTTRIALWRETVSECARIAEAFAAFCRRPEPHRIQPIN